MKLLFSILLLFALSAHAATIIPASLSSADVQTAINSASANDTIALPSGSATWSVTVTANVPLTVTGNGTNSTFLTINVSNPGGEIDKCGLLLQGNGTNYVSGITFNGNAFTAWPAITVDNGPALRIHDCLFLNCRTGIQVSGPFGVIDHCRFVDGHDGVRICGVGDGKYNWDHYYPISFNSLNYLFIEDCSFSIDANMNQSLGEAHAYCSAGQGSSYVVRYCTFSASTNALSPCFDWHGDNNDGTRGNLSTQVYNNTFANTGTSSTWVFCDARGGQGLVYNNTLTSTPGYGTTAACKISEEHPSGTIVEGQLVFDVVTNQWQWNNSQNGATMNSYCSSDSTACAMTSYHDATYTGSYAQTYPHPMVTGTPPAPGSLRIIFSSMSINEQYGPMTVTFLREGGSSGAVSVHYATADGTASAGVQYTSTSGTLSWADGDAANKTVDVPIANLGASGSKNFTLSISSPTGGASLGTITTTTITIIGSGTPTSTIQLLSSNYSVQENAGSITVSASRVGDGTGAVSADYRTLDGSALSNINYSTTSGTFNWADGDLTTKTKVLTILDVPFYGSKSFTFALTNVSGSGATISSPDHAAILIQGVGSPPSPPPDYALLAFNQNAYTVPGTNLSLTLYVNRSADLLYTNTVDYSTADGTGVAGTDYTATSGTLTFTNGISTLPITVPILHTAKTNDVLFTLSLNNPSPYTTIVSPSAVNITISGTVPSSTVPNAPTNSLPVDGALAVSLTPSLRIASYSSPDGAEQTGLGIHIFSGATLAWDYSGGQALNVSVPAGVLAYSTPYTWQARVQDATGWSAWSAATSFATTNAPALMQTFKFNGPITIQIFQSR